MPWCSHCSRTVSRNTEILHRKHKVRPRLVSAAVNAYRASAKVSSIGHKRIAALQRLPSTPGGSDSEMEDIGSVVDQCGNAADVFDSQSSMDVNYVQQATWPGGVRPFAARVNDYDSEDEEEEGDVIGSKFEDDMDNWVDEDEEIDLAEYAEGLSAWDQLGEEFEREAAENGTFLHCVMSVSRSHNLLYSTASKRLGHGTLTGFRIEGRVPHDGQDFCKTAVRIPQRSCSNH